ncbi:MAG: hydroxymethylbilane synthase, partial [Acidimicrobiia bacterium]
ECRADDHVSLQATGAIDDPDVRRAVEAERAFLARLGGGCSLPVGALASLDGDEVAVEALLAAPDGRWARRAQATHRDPATAGGAVAETLLATVEGLEAGVGA